MKQKLTLFGKGAALLLACAVIGAMLLTLAYMLPVNTQIRDASYEQLASEGWYPRASISSASLSAYFHSYYPDVLDGSSDGIILYTAMDDSVGNPLMRAMESYNKVMEQGYTYYWHGYVSVLRPLMLLFDYSQLRLINGACQLFMMFGLAFLIGREKGIKYVFMLVTSYVLLSPIALSLSLQFTWVFYIAYGGTLVLLWKRDFFNEKRRYLFFFIILGALTSYLDLLTYPLVTWGIPLLWWIVMDKTEARESLWLRKVVSTGISWVLGYGIMWVMKWAIASLVLKQNIFESAINEIFVCSGMQAGETFSLFGRLRAVYINWKHYAYTIYALILAVWLVWWVYCICRKGVRQGPKRFAYLLIGFSSIVWYFVLKDHTLGHHFFTHRIFAVSVLAFLAIILDSIPLPEKESIIFSKNRWKEILAFPVILILALFFTLFIREELLVNNGGEQFYTIQVDDGGGLEVAFSPTFQEITGLNLGLESKSRDGECKVTVLEMDTVKYQEIIKLADFDDGHFQKVNAAWKFDKKKSYRLTIEFNNISEAVYVWVTDNGAMPLIEYGELSVNGVAEPGQLLTGIAYWCIPTSRTLQLFIAVSYAGVLLMGWYVLWPMKKQKQNTGFKKNRDI